MKEKYEERYVRIFEDAINRKDEVTNEEWWIWCLIVFHSFPTDEGLRVCEISIPKLCGIYKHLEYRNTYHRVLRLRTGTFSKREPVKKVAKMETPWLYKTNAGHYLPLLGIKPSEVVKNTTFMELEVVKNTTNTESGVVEITNPSGKNYHEYGEKLVKITTPIYKDLNNSLNNTTTTETDAVVAADKKIPLSKFTEEECFRYAQISKQNGDPVRSVIAVAKHAYLTGESDVYIQATLYPEKVEEPPPDAKSDENKANCPRCYGYGLEYIYDAGGNQLGVRPGCKHKPLVPGEYLYEWKVKNEIA